MAQAIANLTGKELAKVAARLAGMDKEAKKALRKRTDIKQELAEMKAKKLANGTTNVTESLDELF